MSQLAVDLVTDSEIPVQAAVRVPAHHLPPAVLPLPLHVLPGQPLSHHLTGGPPDRHALKLCEAHPAPTAVHGVAVSPPTGLVHWGLGEMY